MPGVKVLLISPHFDDVPLSLGQRLLDGEFDGARVTVGVVFSRSNWVKWFSPTRRRWPIATAIRYAEELENGRRFGYRVTRGGFEEVLLRTPLRVAADFRNPELPLDGDLVSSVSALLEGWSRGVDRVIAPLGVGDHVDHRIVASAAAELASVRRIEFYEDRPYASQFPVDDVDAWAERLGGLQLADDGPLVTARKHERVWYPSQLHKVFHDAAEVDLTEGRRERLWVGEPT